MNSKSNARTHTKEYRECEFSKKGNEWGKKNQHQQVKLVNKIPVTYDDVPTHVG